MLKGITQTTTIRVTWFGCVAPAIGSIIMELSQGQLEKIDNYLVFDGPVKLLSWMDNSSHGFKVSLGLNSRAALDPFDNTMKRRKRRGGQKYHVIFQGDQPIQMEAMFCGRGWAESKGAHIALHVPDGDDQRWFRGLNTEDQEGDGETWDMFLLEIGDDELLIDQTKRDKAYRAPVGGPRSKAVAMLLQDDDFGLWLDRESIHAAVYSPDCTPATRTFKARDDLVKNRLGIKSKIELDNGNAQAWNLWEAQFHRPFIQWMQRNAST
jgi:hypothetical protein